MIFFSSHSHGKTINFHSSGQSSEVISLPAAPSLSSYPSIPWRILLPILIVALSLRIAWVITQTNVIENEGAEYVRIAQNLRSGVGYSGMMSGPELLFPPMYPLLIAGASLITRNFELAARSVNVLSGTLLVIPVFLIASVLHGRRAALISALSVSLYPLLIALSASTYSECTYITLLFGGICFGLLWQVHGKTREALLAGLFWGMAYLTRPEAIAFPVVLGLSVLISKFFRHENWTRTLLQATWMLICVLALGSAYVEFLWRHTGQLRFEGKSEVNYVIGARLNAGLSVNEATWGLNQNAEQEGPLLDPDRYLGTKPFPKHLSNMLRYVVMSARRNFWNLRHSPMFPSLFWPLFATAIFAFLPRVRAGGRVVHEILLMCFFALVCLPLAVGPVFSVDRLLLPVIPFAILWSSKGIAEISTRIEIIVSKAVFSKVNSRAVGGVFAIGLGLLVVYFGAHCLQRFPDLLWTKSDVPMKEAGLWLQQHDPGPKRIMSPDTIVPYYCGGVWVPMPSADVSPTMKYIHREHPDFVELQPLHDKLAWQVEQRLDRDPDAHFLGEFDSNSRNTVRIYRWSN